MRDKVSVDAGYRYYALFGLTGAVDHLDAAIRILL